jgi:hypothetical protein
MTDQIAVLMTEIDDIRKELKNINTCLTAIRTDLESQTEYPEEHSKFVDEWVARSKRRRAIWDKVQAQVGGWVIIVILGAIGTYVYSHTVGAFGAK